MASARNDIGGINPIIHGVNITAMQELRAVTKATAGVSTPLHSAQDDNSEGNLYSQSQLVPNRIHLSFRSTIHLDHRWPGPGKSLRLPLPRRINPHLRSVI